MINIKILKLGGSLFTDKNASTGTVKIDIVEQLAFELGEYVLKQDKKKVSLVLALGTGSFGHQPAKQYKVLQKFNPMGTIETYKSVARLSSIILQVLNKHNINAVPVDIMSCVVAKNGRIKSLYIDTIQLLIQNGFVPVILGNVVMDIETKVSIVSSDQIATYLAKELDANALGFGSKEEGVYDASKMIIKEINNKNFGDFEKYIGASEFPDVTDGMLGKVREILQESPVDACIFNAKKSGNILRFLRGEQFGTKIVGYGTDSTNNISKVVTIESKINSKKVNA